MEQREPSQDSIAQSRGQVRILKARVWRLGWTVGNVIASIAVAMGILAVGWTLVLRIDEWMHGGWLLASDYVLLLFFLFVGHQVIASWRDPAKSWKRRQRRIIARSRKARLNAIAVHSDGVRRLPHRHFERAFMQSFRRRRRVRQVLEETPPGSIVVLRGMSTDAISPSSVPRSFEPILLGQDHGRLKSLDEDQMPVHRPDKFEPDTSSPTSVQKKIAIGLEMSVVMVGAIAVMGMLVVGIAGAAAGLLGMLALAARFGWPLLFLLTIVFWQVVRRRVRSWLVPGGVFFLRYRIWPPNEDVIIAPVAESAIFLDLIGLTALCRANGRVVRFKVPYPLTAFIQGLRSNARTPSADEINSFLADREGTQRGRPEQEQIRPNSIE